VKMLKAMCMASPFLAGTACVDHHMQDDSLIPQCVESPSAADTALAAKNWNDLYMSFGAHKACDDGELAEAYSSVVARLLTEWSNVSSLAQLTAKDPSFDRFLFRHIDDLMTREQAETIVQNTKQHCEAELRAFCIRIQRAASR